MLMLCVFDTEVAFLNSTQIAAFLTLNPDNGIQREDFTSS